MKVQLLPSTFNENGSASARQHFMSIVIDDCVAIDAGSLAFACTDKQRQNVRDIILTHTHLDHIAGLPLFIDDLFSKLAEPLRVHATREMIEILERDIFNWSIYPRFSELANDRGPVVQYVEIKNGSKFQVKHLQIRSVPVNHSVSAAGYLIGDGATSVGITGDTAETEEIWAAFNQTPDLKAVLVECAFPNELEELSHVAHHLTPKKLERELRKFERGRCPVFVINMKPMYRDSIIAQMAESPELNVEIMEVGKVYDW